MLRKGKLRLKKVEKSELVAEFAVDDIVELFAGQPTLKVNEPAIK